MRYKYVCWIFSALSTSKRNKPLAMSTSSLVITGNLRTCPIEITSYFLLLAIGFSTSLLDLERTDHNLAPVFVDDLPLTEDTVWNRRDCVRRVCRHWNDIIEGNPAFWRCVGWGAHAPLEYLGRCLSRAGPMKIDLSLQFRWRLCHYECSNSGILSSDPTSFRRLSQQILDVVLPLRHSLRTLEVSAGCSLEISIIASAMVPLLFGENLRTAIFQQVLPCKADLWPVRVPSNSVLDGQIPSRIQHLAVLGLQMLPPAVFPVMSALAAVDIRFSEHVSSFLQTWRYLDHIIRQAPALQTIRVVVPSAPSFFGSFRVLPVSQATSFSIAFGGPRNANSCVEQFRLPYLESLSLTFESTHYDDDYSGVFQSLLSADNTAIPASPSFQDLKQLCITCGVANKAVTLAVLLSLEKLEVLILHCVGTPESGTKAFLATMFDWSLRREMGFRMTDGGRRVGLRPLLCPNLRHFESWKSDGWIEPKFIHCRRRLGHPLTSVLDIIR